MYHLIAKETHGTKTWTHVLGKNIPNVPMSFSVDRENLSISLIFLPQSDLKEFFSGVLNSSSKLVFSFEIKKVEVKETNYQTVSIFKGMDVIPESGRQLVLHMVTGQFLAPAIYKESCGHFHTLGGDARPYMIKEWAYQDELNQALGLEPVDSETLEKLNKRADSDNHNTRFNPETIFDAITEAISEIFPEAKVQVRKS
ncbi:hypothetical protein [Acinetobacter baumannii]|uniref:hypothetical protein n=1 Tax=Acinetobacter baumannii TaxID=470 RepID=UPI00406D09C2